MTVNIETCINWFEDKKGKVSYSMNHRNGPNSYDCSSAIYFGLRSAGAESNGWAVSTESEHDWLIKNGFERITENTPWTAQRGDIFIWGKKGYSGGAGGHTGIFVSGDDIIHCNYSANGISVGNHDDLWVYAGKPYYYAYRLKKAKPIQTGWQKNDTGWWYVKSDGNYVKNDWIHVGDNWYWATENGYILEYSWKEVDGNWYWFKSGGYMAKSETLTINGKECYFNSWGALVTETKHYRS